MSPDSRGSPGVVETKSRTKLRHLKLDGSWTAIGKSEIEGGRHGHSQGTHLLRRGDHGASRAKFAALVPRGRVDPPQISHPQLERNLDGDQRRGASRRGGLASSRHYRLLRLG